MTFKTSLVSSTRGPASRALLAAAALAVFACGAGGASVARAQTTLINGLGGPQGYGTSCLGGNDDGSSRAIDITPVFPGGVRFFSGTHSRMYVNTNGNISFSNAVPTFTPRAFPVADQPMIAPFWADVDVRDAMCTGADGGTGYAGDCRNPTSNGVWWTLDTTGHRVVVTWDRVGYYRCKTDKVMSFQLVLTPAPTMTCGGAGDFDVEFRFNRCEWNAGEASGGTMGLAGGDMACTTVPFFGEQCPLGRGFPCVGGRCHGIAAQAGFDAGNSRDFVEIMTSRTSTIHTTLCTMSNVGEPGIWRYQIRSGVVVCPGAGGVCETGMPGVCGAGRTRCVGSGTECHPDVAATPERCDALDNDCNGMVDDGDGLCGAEEICDRGRCVGRCFEGGCLPGQTCAASGRCVDTGCESRTCDPGQRCVGGECVGACDHITCPAGQVCSSGRCLDLCTGTTCDDCTVCREGACVVRCQHSPCPGGQTCLADGRCVEASCATVTCMAGEVCRGGACIDACRDAVCPEGEVCRVGNCVPEERPDAGPIAEVDAGTSEGTDAGSGGTGGTDGGTGPGIDGGHRDAGRRGGGGSAAQPGCACHVAHADGQATIPTGAVFFALGLGAVTARRRRRQRRA